MLAPQSRIGSTSNAQRRPHNRHNPQGLSRQKSAGAAATNTAPACAEKNPGESRMRRALQACIQLKAADFTFATTRGPCIVRLFPPPSLSPGRLYGSFKIFSQLPRAIAVTAVPAGMVVAVVGMMTASGTEAVQSTRRRIALNDNIWSVSVSEGAARIPSWSVSEHAGAAVGPVTRIGAVIRICRAGAERERKAVRSRVANANEGQGANRHQGKRHQFHEPLHLHRLS